MCVLGNIILLLIVLHSIILVSNGQSVYYKNVTLTTSSNYTNGVVVSMLKDTHINEDNEWEIEVSSEVGWHMLVSLNCSWGFHPNVPSTITFTLDGTSPTETSLDNDLVIAFSVNSSQYWSSLIPCDYNENGNSYNNLVYNTRIGPLCDTTIPPTQTLYDGNVYDKVNVDPSTPRVDKAGSWRLPYIASYDWQPPHSVIHWPLTFIIQNYPIQNIMYVHLINPTDSYNQSCGFGEAFDNNKGLQIYVGGDNIDEIFKFSQFHIEYFYEFTNNPTTSPTINPITSEPTTDSPTTRTPTYSPTTNTPTYASTTKTPTTHSPTIDTSLSTPKPTTDASTSTPKTDKPTTNIPITNTPITSRPTANSAIIQSLATIEPTTKFPSINDIITTVSDEQIDSTNWVENHMIYYMIGIVLCICICGVIIFCIAYWIKTKQKQNKTMNKNGIQDIISTNNIKSESNLNSLASNNNIMIDDVADSINMVNTITPMGPNEINGEKCQIGEKDIDIPSQQRTDPKMMSVASIVSVQSDYEIEMEDIITPNGFENDKVISGNTKGNNINNKYGNVLCDEFVVDGSSDSENNVVTNEGNADNDTKF